MSGLRQAAVRGTFWSGLSTLFNRGLRFATTVVLARILMPEDFGLFTMCLIVMDIAQLLNDVGFGAALIQRRHLEPEHLVTCFWSNQFIGLALCAVTVLASPWAAAFYHNPAVRPVLAVMALNLVIAPIGSVPWILLNRELRFKELMIAQTASTAVRGVVSLLLAWLGAGVWSLVWGPLAGSVTGSVVNWWFSPWRPSFGWSWRHFRELFRFGKNVFGERFLGYFSANSDFLVTGKFLGAATLGFYNFAYQIPHLAETHLVPVVGRVLFPVLSKIQDDRERLRRGYLQSLRWIAIVSAPFIVGLFVTAPEFIPVVYGERWQPVIAPLQLLCLAGLAHALTSLVWTAQQSVGRPDIGFWWNAATLPLIIGTLVVSARWGILGIATTMLTFSLVLSLAIQHITNRLIGLVWSRWCRVVQVPLSAALGMGLAAAVCRTIMLSHAWPAWAVLVSSAGVGVVVYLGLLMMLDRSVSSEIRELFSMRRQSASQPAAPPEVAIKAAQL